MRTHQTLSLAVVLAAAFTTLQAPLAAQLLPNPVMCPRMPGELDFQWTARCDAEEERATAESRENQARRVAEAQRAMAATARQRAALEKQPLLPASRNRLLGRWETAARPSGNDPFAQIAAMLEGCIIFGAGTVEFGPDRWAVYDETGRNDMGAISYRAGANGAVFGLPAKGGIFELLPFEFETPNRIRLTGVVCTLSRTTAAPASSTRAGGSRPATAATPAAAARGAAPPPAAATRSPWDKYLFKRGQDCPDGQPDIVVDSCTGETPESTCVIVRMDQPLKNGVPVTFTETYAALTRRVASCRHRPLMVLDGKLVFAP